MNSLAGTPTRAFDYIHLTAKVGVFTASEVETQYILFVNEFSTAA